MAQSNIGKTCPYCQFPLKADSEVVECLACKVPHHKECWTENSGCTTFGCRETAYQSVAADRLEISFYEPSGRVSAPARGGGINKLLVASLVITLLAFTGVVFAYINLLSDRSAALPGDAATVPSQNYDPATIAALDADYYIDYENGTIPLGELPIRSQMVDPSWEWEYRLGVNYSDIDWDGDPTPPGEVKPVTWIVVAKDHYEGLDPHVTLLTGELIGLFAFDDSTDRDHYLAEWGYNHWGESGTGNARHGLRPWLNSTGLHSGEGFFRAFSADFKGAVLNTTLLNKEEAWINGSAYSTSDQVFVPSSTELNDEEHRWDYPIGRVYTYFAGAGDAERIAMMFGDGWYEVVEKIYKGDRPKELHGNNWYYQLRSPSGGTNIYIVDYGGRFGIAAGANYGGYGVRPALNLKSGILVSEINR